MSDMGQTASASFTDIHRQIIGELAGVADPLLNQVIHRACSRFLEISRVWRSTPDLGSLLTSVVLNLAKPTNGLTGASLVTYDAYPCYVRWVKIDDVMTPRAFWRVNQPASNATLPTIELLEPYDTTCDADMTVRVCWSSRWDSAVVPDWIYGRYGDIISDMARGELMLMTRKPWTDLTMGAMVKQSGQLAAMRVRSESDLADPMEMTP